MKHARLFPCLAALLLPACGGEKPPAETIHDQLDTAQEAIEKAGDSMGKLRAEREALAKEIADQTRALDALIEKRLELLDLQLVALEGQLARLPASRETELRAQIEAMRQRRGELDGKAKAWRAAPAGNQEALRDALAAYQKDLDAIDTAIRDADTEASAAPSAG